MKPSSIQASLVRSSKRFLQTVQQPSSAASVSPMVFGATHISELNHSTASNLKKDDPADSKWTTYALPKFGINPLDRKPSSVSHTGSSHKTSSTAFSIPFSQPLRQAKPLSTTQSNTSSTNPSTTFKASPLTFTPSQSQQSTPSTPPPPQPKTTAATAAPRRKLRPRKAAISLTKTAVSHLQSLLDQPDPKLIRIGVKNRGCSGLTYHLEYVDKPGKFDEEILQDGVKVLIDSKALFSIIGSEMDWVDDKLSSRFVFHNPNSKGQCGCGESFMV